MNTSKKKYKIQRMLYILSVCSDISISTINIDAYTQLINLLESSLEVNADELVIIKNLISKNTSLLDCCTENNLKIITKIFEGSLKNEIDKILWQNRNSLPNPIYKELSQHFTVLKIFRKIHYFRISYYFENNKKDNKTFSNCIGLKEYCKCFNEQIIIFGSFWDYSTYIGGSHKVIVVNIENKLKQMISNLQTNLTNDFTQGQEIFILGNINSYMIEKEKIFINKSNFIYQTIEVLLNSFKDDELLEELIELQGFEYFNLVSNLFFFIYETENELKKQIELQKYKRSTNSFLNKLKLLFRRTKDEKNYEIIFTRHLSYQGKTAIQLIFNTNKPQSIQLGTIQSEEYNQDFITIEDKDNFFANKQDKDNFKDIVEHFYSDYNKFSFISETQKDKIWFNITKNDLQNIHFNDIKDIAARITKEANNIMSGTISTYYTYNAPTDSLSLQYLYCSKDTNINEVKHNLYDKLNELSEDWSKELTTRENSSIYRTVDNMCISSKFKSSKKINKTECSVLSDEISENLTTNQVYKEYNITINDLIAIPILFHNRKLGVLHISSIYKNEFTHRNRIRLSNFIKMIETDFFEANLLLTLTNINKELNQILDNKLKEFDFFNNISKHLSNLLGANGVSILWKNNKFNQNSYKVLGSAGHKLKYIFGAEAIFEKQNLKILKRTDFTNFEIKSFDLKDDIHHISKTLISVNISGCISIPFKNGEGLLLIFDKQFSEISNHLKDELGFIRDYVQEKLLHYFSSKGQINNLKQMVGHELDGQLRTIYGATNRIENFNNSHKLINYQIINPLKDIRDNILSAHKLMDYITDEKINKNLTADNILLSAISRFDTTGKIESVNLKEVLQNLLHSNLIELKQKNIIFKLDILGSINLDLNKDMLIRVFNNLILNVIKYGLQRTELKVYSDYANGQWSIYFENIGYSLNETAKNNTNFVFEKETRCLKDKNLVQRIEGKGLGLFSAKEIAKNWGGSLMLNYKELTKQEAKYIFSVSFPAWLKTQIKDNK